MFGPRGMKMRRGPFWSGKPCCPPPPPPPFFELMQKRFRWRMTHAHVVEKDDEIVVYILAPGLQKETVDIKVRSDRLYIKGKFKDDLQEILGEEYENWFYLDYSVDPESGKAKYNDGVIELHFKRTEPSSDIKVTD